MKAPTWTEARAFLARRTKGQIFAGVVVILALLWVGSGLFTRASHSSQALSDMQAEAFSGSTIGIARDRASQVMLRQLKLIGRSMEVARATSTSAETIWLKEDLIDFSAEVEGLGRLTVTLEKHAKVNLEDHPEKLKETLTELERIREDAKRNEEMLRRTLKLPESSKPGV